MEELKLATIGTKYINPLHKVLFTEYQYESYLKKYDLSRATGTSTVLAFKLIIKAMEEPYTWFCIYDHFGSRQANKHLMHMIQDYLTRLGFKEFYFITDQEGIHWISFGKPDKNP